MNLSLQQELKYQKLLISQMILLEILALNLARIATIPGRSTIGIELPNSSRENVYLSEILSNSDFNKKDIRLPIALGKNISGVPIVGDLASMPHLLIAGTTGSGKSVCINTIILSLLYRHTPDKCKFHTNRS